jgi:diacylglycerol O-acyltransferase
MPLGIEEFWPAGSISRDKTWADREVAIPGRGTISIREARGPAGAPVLVLLHGLAATGRLNWYTALPALAKHYRVIVLDHRGHGRGISTHRFRLADCADDAIALADELGIERFVAVGYSMGGPIAKLCWHRHRARVSGLVLCATANHFATPQARAALSAVFPGAVVAARLLPELFRARIVESMLRGIPAGPRRDRALVEMEKCNAATILQATRAVIRFSSHDWASDIRVPTAVLVMTKDRIVPPKRQYGLARRIPDAKVFEVDADHLACVSAAGRFVPALVEACAYVVARAEGRSAKRRPRAGKTVAKSVA